MKVIQSFRVASLAAAFALTLGMSSWAAASNANRAADQTNATSAATSVATATPIDPGQLVLLTPGTAAQSPLDNNDLNYRQFSFKGKANELVNVKANILTGNMGITVDITSQSGSDVGSASGGFVTGFVLTVKLPQDGNYKIRVSSENPGSGDFAAGTISVQVDDAPAATPMAAATMAATVTK